MRVLARTFTAALLLGLVVAAPTRAAEPDYSGLQDLYRQYVRILPAPKGQPYDVRFDYEQLFIDEQVWQTKRADRLATLHGALLSVDPATLAPRERTAWAINTYNLLVLERLVLGLLVPGRKFMRYDSPRQIHDDGGSFFGAAIAKLGGRDYSLAGFERRFVYGDTASETLHDGVMAREQGGDPRLQFALHKAALCTGLFSPWVYRADSLEAQLDRATRQALALPRFVAIDAAAGQVIASNRFFEERADFGGPDLPGLMPFLERHAPAALKKFIRDKKLVRVGRFFEPNWKLDQYDHPAPKLPTESGAAPPAGK